MRRFAQYRFLMKTAAAFAFAAGILAILAVPVGSGAQDGLNPKVYLLEIDGPIGPATAEYFSNSLMKARENGASLIILQMDTPGGLDTAMRDIIKDILASPIPVASFVAPQGARAASAGTYIMYASHIAAMAPGTNLGAATPVQLQGPPTSLPKPAKPSGDGEAEKDETEEAAQAKDAMTTKAISDAAAYIRGLAELRGRNVEWAVKAVREADSLSYSEALEQNVIDLVAANVPDLLKALEGRVVKMQYGEVTLALEGAIVERVEPNWRTQILATITNPNVALILMMIGMYGLILEFYNPGAIVPGTIGAICLLLALYALNVLPVNYAGLALIMLGLALMVAEAFAPSFGILGLGGGAAFILGATLLFDTDAPGFKLSWTVIIGTAAVGGGLMFLILGMAVRAHRRPVVVGAEDVPHHPARVIDWSGSSGHVEFQGERWRANGPPGLEPGAGVKIVDRDGLTMVVAQQDAIEEGAA